MPIPVPVIVAVIGAVATIFKSGKDAEGKRAEAVAVAVVAACLAIVIGGLCAVGLAIWLW